MDDQEELIKGLAHEIDTEWPAEMRIAFSYMANYDSIKEIAKAMNVQYDRAKTLIKEVNKLLNEWCDRVNPPRKSDSKEARPRYKKKGKVTDI